VRALKTCRGGEIRWGKLPEVTGLKKKQNKICRAGVHMAQRSMRFGSGCFQSLPCHKYLAEPEGAAGLGLSATCPR